MKQEVSATIVLGLAALAAIMFDVQNQAHAQIVPGSWPPKSCTIDLPGGGETTVQCSVTQSDCALYQQVIPNGTQYNCYSVGNRYRACVPVCNTSGTVVDVACVCACLDDAPPRHQNCTES